MGVVVGIDLGTTNTVVAAMQNGAPTAIRDETGSSLIPSIVSFLPSGAVLVGSAARERRSEDNKNTIYSVKRLIGRPWDSPEVRQARARFSFELREGPGRATFVSARNETFTLPEISAYVLRKAKSIAEIELGEVVDRAVITVPANFNDLQRAATKVAGRVAGLEVLRILNEPTAAALAYGYNHGTSEKIAVFDFGGGTFDITLLSLTENVFEVLATAGNTFLGGDDLDWAIAERMADEFLAHHGRDARQFPAAVEQLRAAAEAVKIRLTHENEVSEALQISLEPNGGVLPLSFAMSRTEFEALASPVVDRTFDVCREALGVARVGITDIDHVVMVGGCTKIPFIRRRVEEYFRRQADAHLDPHEVVALGAALQAHALTTRTSSSRVQIPAAPRPKPAEPELSTSSTEWRQKTQPFGRLGSTNIGVGPSAGTPANIQVPPPEEALSRPIPTTKHFSSRGRLNTAIGIGPSESGETEDLLPIVAAEPSGDELPLLDETWDDEEATKVRPSPDAAADSSVALEDLRAQDAASLTDDVTVKVPRGKLESMAARSLDESDRRQSEFPTSPPPSPDADLPAMTTTSSSSVPSSQDARRPSRTPSADELRQRYGDLPLIIGGKRLGTRTPTERPAAERADLGELPVVKSTVPRPLAENPEPAELPVVRPSGPRSPPLNLDPGELPVVRSTSPRQPVEFPDPGQLPIVRPAGPRPAAINLDPGDLPVVRSTGPRPPPTAGVDPVELPVIRPPLDTIVDDSPAMARSPLTGPGYVHDSTLDAELPLVGIVTPESQLQRPRNAPTRPTMKLEQSPRPMHDVPYSLNDSDLVEEPRSQPPSTGRISVRPAMRAEPIAEAALPIPDIPSSPAQPPPSERQTATTGYGSTRPILNAPLAVDPRRAATAVPSRPRTEAPLARSENRRPMAEPTLPMTATLPLANFPRQDSAPSYPKSQPQQSRFGVGVPLLIDVTPLSLCVETVGTYCDVIIDRNTPVPCERTREFVTVQDGQQVVKVRVAQGESRVFAENLLLGELELTGLRPVPRGQLKISVTFGLDSDGILHVRAIDLDTGRAATSELRLSGIPSAADVEQMVSRHMTTA